MRYAFFPRTRPWPAGPERTRVREQGVASLVVVFLLFVFSGLGLSMICLSQAYLKMNAYRKFSVFLDYASENGIKRGLRDLAAWVESAGPVVPIAAGRLEDLREDPRAVFPLLLEEALGAGFPRLLRESADGSNWESLSTCGLERIEDRGSYCRILADLRIESSGGWGRLPPKRISSLEGTLGVLAGYLPLPSIPLLINKEMTEAEKSGFMKANGISFLSGKGNVLAPPFVATGNGIIPKDATRLAARALDVRIFMPQDLSPVRLRAALGLEPSEDPVPDGVYLIKNDLGLGGIFVQGDADEMVLAIDGDFQAIVFRMSGGEWSLRYSPARSRTDFRTPDAVYSYDLVPLGIIIVNGRIDALGGGIVRSDGTVTMVRDREIPSILGGVSLTIVSSDRITLSSHLILQGARWQEGIPYVKESQSQLVIFSTGRDFVSQAELDGRIAVDGGAPDELKVQASLTAGNGDFEIGGSGKTVEVLGALHAAGYKGNGNSLRIAPDERLAGGGTSDDVPLTAEPRLSVYSFKVLTWKEHE
jgi:hypothetical protein